MKRLVLTGGPQSGKTTILHELGYHFEGDILMVPEVATPLLHSFWHQFDRGGESLAVWLRTFQCAVFPTQIALEEIAEAEAILLDRSLLVFDRGALDGAGYLDLPAEAFAQLFGHEAAALCSRYDVVLHLETQAAIAPDRFGSGTNAARYESPAEAIDVDRRIWEAYASHPDHRKIGASPSFDDKVRQVEAVVRELLQ